ncbi:MAG: hypothetical protein ACRYFK_21110 [Janthinobacterium lividum]
MEAYQQQLLTITRDGDKKLVALRNALLNQLGELDKIGLESEITAAEKMRDNVSKTYDERQKAAREVAHTQIELARLVHDEEVRNAQADAKFEQARQKASATVKVYDSAKDIDEQSASYTRLELAIEDSFGKRLISQKDYDRQVRDLDNRREANEIASLEKEYGETEEVLNRKLALRKKMNGEELTEEQKKEGRRAQIIQAAMEKLQAVAGAYFDYQATKLQAQEANENASYEASVKVAGDNNELKTKLAADHAKKLVAIQLQQAQNERNQALFSITVATAMAVAKSLGQFGLPLAIPFMAADIIAGGLQVAAVLARPLPVPQYFKGRDTGPAEFAQLAERGPELVGKPGSYRLLTTPTLGYLEQGDRVLTAHETRRTLLEHTLVAGQLIPHRQEPGEPVGRQQQLWQEQANLDYQTTHLRQLALRQGELQQLALRQNNAQVVQELRNVRKAVAEQAYLRLNEQGDLVKRIYQGLNKRDEYIKRYNRLPPSYMTFE